MSVENVGNSSSVSLNTGEFTLEKGLMNAVNVEKHLLEGLHILNIRDFILEESLMSAANVGNPLLKPSVLMNIEEFTLEKGLMSAVNVENHFIEALLSFGIKEFTIYVSAPIYVCHVVGVHSASLTDDVLEVNLDCPPLARGIDLLSEKTSMQMCIQSILRLNDCFKRYGNLDL
ncbi:hypothetical protein P7K49_035191 [Saguinus oedipus]|uniref:Uncharacterized protein n=1 Tax=Saguinus oedipus TaxID=9490 RepID=A0ABQ9TWW0_SAGOE|nr:hypothetical protein P7K49_035191 [Saguinus oedipus]